MRSGIVGLPALQGLKGRNDLVQADQHPAVVGGQALTPCGLCLGDERSGGLGLLAVDGQELDRRLEVRAGEAGVGMWAVLLGGRPQ
jgi:hypothetical protein